MEIKKVRLVPPEDLVVSLPLTHPNPPLNTGIHILPGLTLCLKTRYYKGDN